MKVKYSTKSIGCLENIGRYLQENNLDSGFISQHLIELKTSINATLSLFPNSGHEIRVKNATVRRLVIKNYVVLYKYQSAKQLIDIAYIHKQNLPKI